MRNFFKGLWQDESGAAAAEYALILAIVAVGIAVAVTALGTQIGTAIDAACQAINGGTACP
ncbi:MAG TPA: Flp family type IVb pilin [Kiloniellaceae bacterium]